MANDVITNITNELFNMSQVDNLLDIPKNINGLAEGDEFHLSSVFLLKKSWLHEWWEIALYIFMWMFISYTMLFIGAAITAFVFIRRHAYFLLFVVPMLAMCIIGPVTVGTITSMSLAFALSASYEPVSVWYCVFLGISQTVLVVVVSFSRLLGTL